MKANVAYISEMTAEAQSISQNHKSASPLFEPKEPYPPIVIPDTNGWEYRTIQDAYDTDDKINYIVDGIIPEDSLCLFFGQPGSLKTMIIMDMVMCILIGKDWLSNDSVSSFTTVQNKVLWLDMDNGQRRSDSRVKAMAKGHGLPANIPHFAYVSFPSPSFTASDSTRVYNLCQDINDFGSKVVVIDNLLSVSGDADENSPKMRDVMLGLRMLAEKTNATVIVIHHTPKDESVENYRGHSSIGQYSDLLVFVKREDDLVTMRATKERDYPVPNFSAKWEHEVMDKSLVWGKFRGVKSTFNPMITKIIEYVSEHPGQNQGAIIEAVGQSPGLSKKKIRNTIIWLADENKILEKQGETTSSKVYFPI